MSSPDLAGIKNWVAKNKTGHMSRRCVPCVSVSYSYIYNKNIYIEGATSDTPPILPGVSGVTNPMNSFPLTHQAHHDNLCGVIIYPIISMGSHLTHLTHRKKGDSDFFSSELFFQELLAWVKPQFEGWPEQTRQSIGKVRTWFEGKGFVSPVADVLAFVTLRELINLKRGLIVLDPELARLEKDAKEVFGPTTFIYLNPEAVEKGQDC